MQTPKAQTVISAARPQRRKRLFLSLRERRGSSALEFAVVGSALILLVIAIIESFLQLAVSAALEFSALRASRFGITGVNTVRGFTAAQLPSTCRSQIIPWIVNYATGGFLRSANLTVTMNVYSTLAAGEAGTGGTTGAGAGGAIVGYRLDYSQPLLTPLARVVIGRNSVTHTTTLLVKNEPFENATC